MAYDAKADQEELRKLEKELVEIATEEYNALIVLLISIGLSKQSKRKKIAFIREALKRIKRFNTRFVQKMYSRIYREQYKIGLDLAKEALRSVGERQINNGTPDERKVYEEARQRIKDARKRLNDAQQAEADNFADRLQEDLDQKAEQYAANARQLVLRQELAELREDELGYTDGAEKRVIRRDEFRQDIMFIDSKGRRITTDAILSIIVGDAIWRSSTSARNSAWLGSGMKYGIHHSVVDERTTAICLRLDGEVRDLRKDQLPPLHPNCRSTIEPLFFRPS